MMTDKRNRVPKGHGRPFFALYMEKGHANMNTRTGSSAGGRRTPQSDVSSTPQWLFDVLNEQVRVLTGQDIQLDAAACAWNAKCKFYFDERADALRQDWSKWPTIFCNPPFSAELIARFAVKALDAAASGSTVVLILPSWPGYAWFQDLKRRGQVQDIITPVAFQRSDGSKFVLNKGNGMSLVVVTLGPKVVPANNGEPITKRQDAVCSPLASGIHQPKVPVEHVITDPPILTCYQCNNDFLMAQVAKLYFRSGDRICDGSYGQGTFWKLIDLSQYDFHPSDLLTVPGHAHDFRNLPYRSEDFDVYALDPPYMHHPNSSHRRIHGVNYRNAETTRGLAHNDIIQLYRDGMIEAHRILRPAGLMLVKCQDEIESGRQRITHIEIHNIAVNELGMEIQDLFVLMQKRPLLHFGRPAQHARKNHSYLWVFRKQDGPFHKRRRYHERDT